MAMTATAQSPFTRERTWDQVIVPTLRKRLQDESHVLAKRMSVASITSEDGRQSLDTYQSDVRERFAAPTYAYSKPSAIPRPSLQHSRTDTATSSTGRSSNSGSFKRPRTNSQPFPFDPQTMANGSSPPLPQQPTRSESPYAAPAKGTRIPVSRGRTGSTSSFQPSINGKSDSKSGLSKINGAGYTYDTTASAVELYPVEEIQASTVNSRSTAFRTPRSQFSDLANEQAPFNTNSVSSRLYNQQPPDPPPRPSNDSEERPFEHWYRGDVSRNGGVGELRVARKQEMLDIANYGHTLRQASARLAATGGTRSRSNSQGQDGLMDSPRSRPRAGSLGARQSIYLDEDEQARVAAMVLDEQPLTDLDSDGELEDDEFDDGYGDEDMTERQAYSPPIDESISPPQSIYDRSTTPTSTKEFNKATFQSRIPTPTPRAFVEPSRTPTPTQAVSTPSTPRSRTNQQPQQQSASANAKRRGKSPSATASTNAAKRARTAKSKSPAKKQTKEEQRRSASVYPSTDGDDVTHAIPSWTQPVESNGNWDDVVLPAVARKKGLEGYEQADGSPKPRSTGPIVYAPAPGTFGFDHSKYRPPRHSNEIPMDEFGQRQDPSSPPSSPPPKSSLGSPVKFNQPAPSPQPTIQRRVESPAPFAHYAPEDGGVGAAPGTKDMPQPVVTEQRDEDGGGCCKCVIM